MKKIINILKQDWVILIIIALQFIIIACFYKSIPDKIPIHWNGNGDATSYVGKLYGTLSILLINLVTYIILLIIPLIDPKRKNYEKFKSTYQYLKYIVVISSFVMLIISIVSFSGTAFSRSTIVNTIGSLVIILIGNVMGRIKYTYFVGIRTPWTLANEAVWTKTHRMAGPIWVMGGIINMFLGFTKINLETITPLIIVIIAFIPIVYSYIEYFKISKDYK